MKWAYDIWEGLITNGLPDGFARHLNGKEQYLFVGYMENLVKIHHGTGFFFKYGKLLYQGYYGDNEKLD